MTLSLAACTYSFVKGSLPYRDIAVKQIINNSYYDILSEISNQAIYDIFPQYASVQIKDNSENVLTMTINEYERIPSNYDDNGNIINYDYLLKTLFSINEDAKPVNIRRNMPAELTEEQCRDSIVNDAVKNYIDKIRESM